MIPSGKGHHEMILMPDDETAASSPLPARFGPSQSWSIAEAMKLPPSSALALFLGDEQGEHRDAYALRAGRQRAGRARARRRTFFGPRLQYREPHRRRGAASTHLSRITIVTSGTPEVIEQITPPAGAAGADPQGHRSHASSGRSVERELAMIKVAATGGTASRRCGSPTPSAPASSTPRSRALSSSSPASPTRSISSSS